MPVPDLAILLAANLVMALGAGVQSAFGIGFALVVVPLLTLIDPAFVPGPALFAGIPLCLVGLWRERSAIDPRGLSLALAGLAAGTVAGAAVLLVIAGQGPTKLFALLILAAVALAAFGRPIAQTTVTLPLAGAASGLMGTITGIHGPPIALVLLNAEPPAARSMLNAFFAVAATGSLAALALAGLFGTAGIVRGASLVPGVVAGLVAGPKLARFVDRARLRAAILVVSAASAVILLLR